MLLFSRVTGKYCTLFIIQIAVQESIHSVQAYNFGLMVFSHLPFVLDRANWGLMGRITNCQQATLLQNTVRVSQRERDKHCNLTIV